MDQGSTDLETTKMSLRNCRVWNTAAAKKDIAKLFPLFIPKGIPGLIFSAISDILWSDGSMQAEVGGEEEPDESCVVFTRGIECLELIFMGIFTEVLNRMYPIW